MNDGKPRSRKKAAAPAEGKSGGVWWRRFAKNLGGAPRTREDLVQLLREANTNQLLDADALSMFQGILGTAETQVRDVMVPRAQMVSVRRSWALDRILPVVVESGHSRFPVLSDPKDEVAG
ncbi:MAG TPA: magnesium/cobalt efflux protein, partial [Nevskiaceae bacterium]|nr:magnesium/cobalt efflux protein [Nevskiaceae bacterium]